MMTPETTLEPMQKPPASAAHYDDTFIAAWELAERLQIAKKSIPQMVARGLLPRPVKIGRLARWYWPTVAGFLNRMSDRKAVFG